MLQATLLLALVLSASSYSVQGNWTLLSARYLNLGNQPIVLNIADYIFKNQTILQKLTFIGCQQMLLQAQFSEDQLLINSKSYFT
jgi:hypothetical protein